MSEPHNLPTPSPAHEIEQTQLDEAQQLVVEEILGGRNVFITGAAGSGKTKVLETAILRLRATGKRVRIAAPTGQAACNVGGMTLHSLFGLNPNIMMKSLNQLERMVELSETLREHLGSMNVLVIDEISMVENIFFERLSRLVQAAKDNDECFGGVQLVICGDFHQLPPVLPFSYCFKCGKSSTADLEKLRNRQRRVTMYRCPKCLGEEDANKQWAFCAQAWDNAAFVNIMLRQNHRQCEPELQECLSVSRRGDILNHAQRDYLYRHPCDVEGGIHIFATNDEVDALNDSEFRRLDGAQMDFDCVDDFSGTHHHPEFRDFATRSKDGITLRALTQHPYKAKLKLKIGMPVVLSRNIDVEDHLVNGSQGKVVGFRDHDAASLPRMAVNQYSSDTRSVEDLEQLAAGVLRHSGGEGFYYRQEQIKEFVQSGIAGTTLPVVKFPGHEPMTIFPDCSVTELGDEGPYSRLSRTQIPLLPGWAMTVHKAQGRTLDKVTVNVSKFRSSAQAYVALSRARNSYGLKVQGNDNGLDGAGADTEVKAFMARIVWYEA